MRLIGYLSNGFPNLVSSLEAAEYYVAGGCDSLIVDIPDPHARMSSSILMSRMKAALQHCDNWRNYLDNAVQMQRFLSKTDIMILMDAHTAEGIGEDKLGEILLSEDFQDIILTGSENNHLQSLLIAQGLRVSCYFSVDRPEDSLESAKTANGFIVLHVDKYAVEDRYTALCDCIRFLREQGVTRPIFCDIGVTAPEDIKIAKEAKCEGVIVGSALPPLNDNPDKSISEIAAMKLVTE